MKELLPVTFLRQWNLEGLEKSRLQEIRLRTGQPVTLTYDGKEVLLNRHPVSQKELKTILEWLCGYGVYAYQTEMAKGYITIKGGHRVGIGGQVVLDKTGQVTQMKYISSLLIRVSHQVVGAAEGVIGQLYEENAFKSTLILSPPGCGKTTLLRDLVRLVSERIVPR